MNLSDNVGETKTAQVFAIEKDDCIRCASCSTIAPANFYVETAGANILRQPVNEAELKQCETAMINCPTAAITRVPSYASQSAAG